MPLGASGSPLGGLPVEEAAFTTRVFTHYFEYTPFNRHLPNHRESSILVCRRHAITAATPSPTTRARELTLHSCHRRP